MGQRPPLSRRCFLLLAALVLAACKAGEPPRPDVFVVVIDTARRDAYRTFHPGLPIGTALDALAGDGIAFERLRSPTSWTRTAVATLLTGLTPWQHGVLDYRDALAPDLETLPALLRERGYRTLGWSANGHVLPQWGFANGFDALTDLGGRDATAVFDAAQNALPGEPGPVFFYLHLIDPHAPYRPPEEHVQALRDPPAEALAEIGGADVDGEDRLLYLAEVRHADLALGRFLDFLRRQGRYRDSLILVVGDHGEELFDHGRQGHGHALYEELLRIPGVLKLPGNRRAGERIARDVELHDLLTTVALQVGAAPPAGSPGVDALSPGGPERSHAYIVEARRVAALRRGDWKLIVDFAAGQSALFDLKRDPTEQRDLAAQEPERVAELRAALDVVSARHAPGWHLRACGCRTPERLRLRIEGASAVSAALELEPADRTSASGGGLAVDLDLSPAPPTPGARPVPDEDELVLGPVGPGAAAPTLLPQDALQVAFGNLRPHEIREPLSLADLPRTAETGPGEPVPCPQPPPRCRPHLRIWHVAPAVDVPLEQVDPELLERLRALGYQL